MLCSHCFLNQGLKIESEKIGELDNTTCNNCGSTSGKKLNSSKLNDLAEIFFGKGSIDLRTSTFEPKYWVVNGDKPFHKIEFDHTLQNDYELLLKNSDFRLWQNASRRTTVGIWGVNGELREFKNAQTPSEETYVKFENVLDKIINYHSKYHLITGTKIYRIRKSSPDLKNIEDALEYDAPPLINTSEKIEGFNRFGGGVIPIFYCSLGIETCIHEVKTGVEDELILATFEVQKDLELIDFENINRETGSSFDSEDIAYFIRRMLFSKDHTDSMYLGTRIRKLGYSGIKFRSYHTKVSRDLDSNIIVFGYPVKDKIFKLQSLNRISLEEVKYQYRLGPIWRKKHDEKEIKKIIDERHKINRSKLSEKDFEKELDEIENIEAYNIHSLGQIMRIYMVGFDNPTVNSSE